MFDHVTIRVGDRTASELFYDTVLAPLGIDRTYRTETFSEWGDFSLAGADERNPPTRRLHVGFVAPSRDQVDEFWRAGTEAGYRDDGEPGPRPEYRSDYYGAFLLDPDGNSAEAVHHGELRSGGVVDHLWIRVADVTAAGRFYETIAPHAGLRLEPDSPHGVFVTGGTGSFSLVSGTPTENLHLAFPPRTMTTSSGSIRPRSMPATKAGGHPANVRVTTPATTRPTSWIPTATTSSSSTTTGPDNSSEARVELLEQLA